MNRRRVLLKKNLMATIMLLVIGLGGLTILNHQFPSSMYEGYRFTINCLGILVIGAIIAFLWIWNS